MTPPERLQQRVHLGAGHGLRGRLPPHRQRQRQLLHLRLHVRQLQVNPPPPLQTVPRVRADRDLRTAQDSIPTYTSNSAGTFIGASCQAPAVSR